MPAQAAVTPATPTRNAVCAPVDFSPEIDYSYQSTALSLSMPRIENLLKKGISNMQTKLYQAMTEYLHRTFPDEDIVAVTDIQEEAYAVGGCDTCGDFTEIELTISYTTKEPNLYGNKRGSKTINDMSLISWIKELCPE